MKKGLYLGSACLLILIIAAAVAYVAIEVDAKRRARVARETLETSQELIGTTREIDEWLRPVRSEPGDAFDDLAAALMQYPGEEALESFRVAGTKSTTGPRELLPQYLGYDPYSDSLRLRQMGRELLREAEQLDPEASREVSMQVLSVGRHLASVYSPTAYRAGVDLQCSALADLRGVFPADDVTRLMKNLDVEQRVLLDRHFYMREASLDPHNLPWLAELAADESVYPLARADAVLAIGTGHLTHPNRVVLGPHENRLRTLETLDPHRPLVRSVVEAKRQLAFSLAERAHSYHYYMELREPVIGPASACAYERVASSVGVDEPE